MFEEVLVDDPGDDLSVAAVEALRSAAAVRACADAVELQSLATLAQVRRSQARREAQRRAELHRRERPGTPARPVHVDLDQVDRCTAQEVSLTLWLSPVAARARLELALELVEERPATFEALRTGSIDLVRARRIVDAVRVLGAEPAPTSKPSPDGDAPPDGAADVTAAPIDLPSAVEAEALYPGSVPVLAELRPGRPASELTPAQLTARLGRLVLRAAPASATRRTEVADERRACTLRVLPDGMALLSVTGRMELLGAAFDKVDATARALIAADAAPAGTAASGAAVAGASAGTDPATGGPTATTAAGMAPVPHDAGRTLDQTRVDVLLASILGHSDDLAQAPGVQVTLALVAPAGTVLAGGDEPGDLLGVGPVPAPLVRRLAADAAWVRWASDPVTGEVTGLGRRRYRPSAAVADAVRARDERCRFPSCRRRARACDLDHVVPFPSGDTEAGNLYALCRTHHLVKHRGGFRLRRGPDGTAVWTTPTGQEVVDPPRRWGSHKPPPRGLDGPAAGEADGEPAPF